MFRGTFSFVDWKPKWQKEFFGWLLFGDILCIKLNFYHKSLWGLLRFRGLFWSFCKTPYGCPGPTKPHQNFNGRGSFMLFCFFFQLSSFVAGAWGSNPGISQNHPFLYHYFSFSFFSFPYFLSEFYFFFFFIFLLFFPFLFPFQIIFHSQKLLKPWGLNLTSK